MKVSIKTVVITILVMISVTIGGTVFAQDPKAPAERNVNYPGPNGETLSGYLAVPSGSGPYPGVVMVHEWWGLNHDTTVLADALAEEGYVVLAADAFRGNVAQVPADAMKQVRGTPQEQIASDLDAALDFRRSHSKVDKDRVASLGFCFGGTQSMYMGTRNPELASVVIFYGGGPIQSADELGNMRQAGPVLGIYGQEDGNIPVTEVRNFEDALNSRNVENTITVYDGVGHAFVKSDTYKSGTAREAWDQMVDFLNRNVK